MYEKVFPINIAKAKLILAIILVPAFLLAVTISAIAKAGVQAETQTTALENQSQPRSVLAIASVVTETISYQGVLEENDSPVSGSYDMIFRLYSDDSCTTQVGGDIVKNGVAVDNGLFDVKLSVDQDDFNGQGLWLEAAVDGTKIGCQEILPVPYALSLRPEAIIATESTVSGIAAITGVISTTSSGKFSSGVAGVNNGTSSYGVGVWGSHDGSGWGVYGTAANGGTGVYGEAYGEEGIGVLGYTYGSDGAGVYAASDVVTGTALLLATGGIRVDGAGLGTSTPVFIHKVTAGNIKCDFDQCTEIDHPLTNGDIGAILFVTQNWSVGNTYNPHPVGVYYTGSKWRIFNEDEDPMPISAGFNVLVVKP